MVPLKDQAWNTLEVRHESLLCGFKGSYILILCQALWDTLHVLSQHNSQWTHEVGYFTHELISTGGEGLSMTSDAFLLLLETELMLPLDFRESLGALENQGAEFWEKKSTEMAPISALRISLSAYTEENQGSFLIQTNEMIRSTLPQHSIQKGPKGVA